MLVILYMNMVLEEAAKKNLKILLNVRDIQAQIGLY